MRTIKWGDIAKKNAGQQKAYYWFNEFLLVIFNMQKKHAFEIISEVLVKSRLDFAMPVAGLAQIFLS